MELITTLVAALMGAGLGAFFTFVKFKNEKIWHEKYQVLSEIVDDLNLINHEYTIEHMHGMGLTVATKSDLDQIYKESAAVKTRLSRNISRLQLLFRKHDIENILEARIELNSAFLDLLNVSPHEYQPDFLESVANRADEMLEKVIGLAQTKIV